MSPKAYPQTLSIGDVCALTWVERFDIRGDLEGESIVRAQTFEFRREAGYPAYEAVMTALSELIAELKERHTQLELPDIMEPQEEEVSPYDNPAER